MDYSARPPGLPVWHHPRPLHPCLGLHPGQLQGSLPGQRPRLLRAGPDRPLHNLGTGQLPAAAARGEPAGRAAPRALLASEAPPGLREADDAIMDDTRAAGQGALCRLPVQRHRWQLGAQEAGVGDAHGELTHGDRCSLPWRASA